MPAIGSRNITAIHISLRMTPDLPINTLTMAKISKPSITAPTRLIAVGNILVLSLEDDRCRQDLCLGSLSLSCAPKSVRVSRTLLFTAVSRQKPKGMCPMNKSTSTITSTSPKPPLGP